MQPDLTKKSEQFTAALSDALRSTASAQSGSPWESRVGLKTPGGAEALQASSIAIAMRLAGNLSGEVLLCIDREVSRRMLPSGAEPAQEDEPSPWLQLLQSSAKRLEERLGPLFGAITVEDCRAALPREAMAPLASLAMRSAEGVDGEISLLMDGELLASLERATAPGKNSVADEAQGVHLQRVIDVPLSVTLRFGQRQLTIRDLLDLRTGSLVELDRQVEEPVELMLGERIVARGEVVIVDGNYGMRVTEVLENPATRLQSQTSPNDQPTR